MILKKRKKGFNSCEYSNLIIERDPSSIFKTKKSIKIHIFMNGNVRNAYINTVHWISKKVSISVTNIHFKGE